MLIPKLKDISNTGALGFLLLFLSSFASAGVKINPFTGKPDLSGSGLSASTVNVGGTLVFSDSSTMNSAGVKYLMVGQRRGQVDFQGTGPKHEDTDGYSAYYGLYFLDSADNVNFNPIDAYRAIVTTFPGQSMTRDAALFWKNHNFYIQWPHSPIDGKYYDFWKSSDLITWTQLSTSVFTVPNVTKVYGTDWFIDPSQNNQIYMLMSPFTSSPSGNYAWWTTPISGNNPEGSWTTPIRMPTNRAAPNDYLQGYDNTIAYAQGVYWFWNANAGHTNPGVYTSTSMSGIWQYQGGNGSLDGFEGESFVETSTGPSNTFRLWMDPTVNYDLWSAYADVTFTSTYTWTLGTIQYANITPGMKGVQVLRLADNEAISKVNNAVISYKDQHIEDMVHVSTNLSEYASSGNQELTPQYNWPVRIYTLQDPGANTNNFLDLRVQRLDPDDIGFGNAPLAQDISKRIPAGWTWKFIINTASTTKAWNITTRQVYDDDGGGGGTYDSMCVVKGTTTAQKYYEEFIWNGSSYVTKSCIRISTDSTIVNPYSDGSQIYAPSFSVTNATSGNNMFKVNTAGHGLLGTTEFGPSQNIGTAFPSLSIYTTGGDAFNVGSSQGWVEIGVNVVGAEMGLISGTDEFIAVKDNFPTGNFTYGNGALHLGAAGWATFAGSATIPGALSAPTIVSTTAVIVSSIAIPNGNIFVNSVALGTVISTYSASGAFNLGTTTNTLAIGTSSSTITVKSSGTFIVQMCGNYRYNAVTFAANQFLSQFLYRQNNTPGIIANSQSIEELAVIAVASTNQFGQYCRQVTYTTTNTNDVLSLEAQITATPGAGNFQATEASLIAFGPF